MHCSHHIVENNKLKNSKKSLKKQEKDNRKNVKQARGKREKLGKSKFFEKYRDRIESIQESDLKQQERQKQMQKGRRAKSRMSK